MALKTTILTATPSARVPLSNRITAAVTSAQFFHLVSQPCESMSCSPVLLHALSPSLPHQDVYRAEALLQRCLGL
jgi:hypothetical protein